MHGTPIVAQVALWARCYNQAHGSLFTVSYTVYMILYIHVLLVWFPVALILAPSNTSMSAAWADADQSMNFGDRRDRLAIRVARSWEHVPRRGLLATRARKIGSVLPGMISAGRRWKRACNIIVRMKTRKDRVWNKKGKSKAKLRGTCITLILLSVSYFGCQYYVHLTEPKFSCVISQLFMHIVWEVFSNRHVCLNF